MHPEQLNLENEIGVRRNIRTGSAFSVRHRGWDYKDSGTARFHGGNAFVPTFDHLTLTNGESERFAAVQRAVKFFAVGQPTSVVNLHLLSALR